MQPDHFKRIRKRNGMSCEDLAIFLRLSPVSERYIRQIEDGTKEASGPITFIMELLENGVIRPDNTTMNECA